MDLSSRPLILSLAIFSLLMNPSKAFFISLTVCLAFLSVLS